MDGYKADVLFLGVAGLQKADDAMEAAFYRETIEKVDPELVIPVHWDNFFSPLTKPVVGIASFISRPPCLVVLFSYDLCQPQDGIRPPAASYCQLTHPARQADM